MDCCSGCSINPTPPYNPQCSVTNYGRVSGWYRVEEINEFLEELVVGDLIEFRRGIGIYEHWAVYAGYRHSSDPQVYNAGSSEEVDGLTVVKDLQFLNKGKNGLGLVTRDPLAKVWKDSEARINNEADFEMQPFSKEDIIYRAEVRINEQEEYHLFKNNCESFAKWCRNNITKSRQATAVLATTLTTMGTCAILLMSGITFAILKYRILSRMLGDDDDDVLLSDGAAKKESKRRSMVEIPLD